MGRRVSSCWKCAPRSKVAAGMRAAVLAAATMPVHVNVIVMQALGVCASPGGTWAGRKGNQCCNYVARFECSLIKHTSKMATGQQASSSTH